MAELIAQALAIATSAWRRRGYAVLIAWLVCFAGWVVVATIPDNYRSSALVYVDTASILKPLLGDLTVDIDVAAEVALMQQTLLSRPNLEKVLRLTDLDLMASNPSEMERMLASLESRIKVQRQGQDLFSIGYDDKDPELARDIVQALLTIFVENNLGHNRQDMETARKFIEDQIDVYEKQLFDAERRLAGFRQENMGLLSAADAFQTQLNAASQALAQGESDLRDANLRRDTLRRELASIPQFFPLESSGEFGPPSQSEFEVINLQSQLEDLLTRYTEKHPDVVAAQRRLAALLAQQERELEAAAERRASLTGEAGGETAYGASNPVYDQLKLQLVQEEANIALLTERVARARASVEKVRESADQVPVVEAELARLNRDYNVLKSNYEQLVSAREAERISRARDVQAEDVKFRIMEAPEVPAIPSGPNRLLFLTAVLIVGLGSGGGFAVVLALSSDTFSNAGQLKSVLSLPVLGSVSVSDIARRSIWAFWKNMAFWSTTSALAAAYSGLLFVETQVGLTEVISSAALSDASSGLIRWLPVY